MATSGSIDFIRTGDELIAGALRAIGALAQGQSITGQTLVDCREALDMLCKQWCAGPNPVTPGLKAWLETMATIALAADQDKYEFKSSGGAVTVDVPPVKILDAWLRDSDNHDHPPLRELTRKQYDRLYSKGVAADDSTPTMYFYDRQLATGDLYLDCEPSDVTTYPSLMVRYLRTIEDFDAANDPDFPQEWYRALKFNLAIDLAPEFGRPVSQEVTVLAIQSLSLANAIHPEIADEDDYFQPGLD